MAKLMLISDTTANENQFVNDIINIREDSDYVSTTELSLFNIQECYNVTKNDIDEVFNEQINPDEEYPKFPFSIDGLTSQQKFDLADQSIGYADTMDIINTIIIKPQL